MAGRKRIAPNATMGDFFISKEITISIYPPDIDNLPVTPIMDELAKAHGHCANCGAPVIHLLSHCACGDIPKEYRDNYVNSPSRPYLVLRISYEHFERYRKAVRDAQYMFNQQQRKDALKRAGGKASKEELQHLWKAQAGHCYYCGGLLTNNSSAHDDIEVHIDHMQPLSCGGSGEIDNLCFTCPRCNLSKNSTTAKHFIRRIGRQGY